MKLNEGFQLLATAPDGVARLRELILSLAVQGKLVPQDPSDEPAKSLLHRIKSDRHEMIKKGRISKDKPLPEIGDHETPFQLPRTWEWVRLGSVSKRVQYGVTASARHDIQSPKFVRITDIQYGRVAWDTVPGVVVDEQAVANHRLEDGDILIARTGGTIGKSFLVYDVPVDAVFASYLIRISPLCINPRYIKVFLSSRIYWDQLYAKAMGTGQPNVNGTALSRLTLPCPPFAEQLRIAEKVDELMHVCDQLEDRGQLEAEQHARLTAAFFDVLVASESSDALTENWARIASHFDLLLDRPEAIDALEQTIVQLAVRGCLVAQDPNDEPASELLENVIAEKSRLVAERKIKREKPLPVISGDEKPFELPEGWEWTRLALLGERFDYGTSQKTSDGQGVPVLRMGNIRRGEIVYDSLKFLEDKLGDLPSLYLCTSDLLFNRTNSYELVGKTAIFAGESNQFSFASYLIRIRLMSGFVSPLYVNMYMNSVDCRRTQIEPQIVQQNGQANFNGTKLQQICVPLPPLAEQARIVVRVEELRRLCADLRKRLIARQTCQARFAEAVIVQSASIASLATHTDHLAAAA